MVMAGRGGGGKEDVVEWGVKAVESPGRPSLVLRKEQVLFGCA